MRTQKLFLVVGLCLLAFGCGVSAQAQLAHHSVSMDVKVVGNGGGAAVKSSAKNENGALVDANGNKLSTSVYENKSNLNRRTVLEISVRNFSQQPDVVQLECYFFAEPVNRSKEFILDSAKQDVSLNGGENQVVKVESKEATTTVVKTMMSSEGYVPLLEKSESGTKMKGWLVRLIGDGKIIQIRGSTSKYEALGRNDAQLNAISTGAPKS